MKNPVRLVHRSKKNQIGKVISWILRPLSWIYCLICAARFFLYRQGLFTKEKLTARVVSIGNITVGGTGKTPLVIYLARKLWERNQKVAILTRGYRRKKKQMVELTAETKERIDWQDVGDEPYLLAGRLPDVPIMVSKSRFLSGKLAIERHGSEILLLDDGFQHLKLSRELDIVVIDSTNPFGNGKLLPAGILREKPNSLERADIIVLTKTDQTSDLDKLTKILRAYNSKVPLVQSIYQISGLEDLFDGSPVDPEKLGKHKALIFSGIGNPSSFEKTIAQLNVNVLEHRIFPDHFAYRKQEMEDLIIKAQAVDADIIITTEKDSVRIPLIKRPEIPIYVLKIDMTIKSGEQLFLNKVEGR